MRYKTCEEIQEAFIADGWGSDTTFTEITDEEAEHHGYYIKQAFSHGRKFFRMNVSGNIYDDEGKIALYNIPIHEQTESSTVI